MKIAIIIRFLTKTGGAQREALMLARELMKRGHEITVYTFAYERENCFLDEFKDIKIEILNLEHSEFLRRMFRMPLVGGYIDRLAENRKARKLAFLIDRDTEILNPHDQGGMRVARHFKKHVRQIPSVLMLNDLHLASWSLFDDPMFNPPRRSFAKKIVHYFRDAYEIFFFFRSQDSIAVLNNRTKDLVKKYIRQDAIVVRSGLDADRFLFRQRGALSGKSINILCHGMFYVHRRFEDVIVAVKALLDSGYDPRLTIMGDFSHKDTALAYYTKLVHLVHELRLVDRIKFTGRVSEETLRSAYHSFDIFVFASHMQTWGLAVFEAMASGLPVILSRSAGASEVLTNEEQALLIDPCNPVGIVHAIIRLMHDPRLYIKLSIQGSNFVRENISWSRYAENMERLFQSVREK